VSRKEMQSKTMQSFPRLRFGRSVDPPGNSNAPVIFSPSDLERKATEPPDPPSIRDVVNRLQKR
jgi:hypothetical protein